MRGSRHGSPGGAEDSLVFSVDLADFDRQVLDASRLRPILVDMWAQWCPPCLVIAPVLADVVARRHGDIALAKVEVDAGENMKLAGRYRVRGFPTVILFENGTERGRFSGAHPARFIDTFIDEHLQRT
jgi:putative thioredoxin